MAEKKRKRDVQDGGVEDGAGEEVKEVKKTKRTDKKEKKDKKEKRKDESSTNGYDEKAEKKKRKQEKRERKERERELKADGDDEEAGEEKVEKEEKEKKKEKKEKKDKEKKEKKKSKKDKKDKKEKEEKVIDTQNDNENGGVPLEQPKDSEPNGDIEAAKATEIAEARDPKTQRFIVFIGNLPFTATTDSVTSHFSKIQPSHIRVPMEKSNNEKARGFAFLEFEAYDRMKTCLKLYHHSSFDDGKSPARRINVELTAGGGGSKSTARKEKLKEKNSKLQQERERDAKESMKKKKGEKDGGESKQGKEAEAEAGPGDDFGDIHPSRRVRMNGAR